MKSINELIKDDPNVKKGFKKVIDPSDYRELLIEMKLRIYEEFLKSVGYDDVISEYENRIGGVGIAGSIDIYNAIESLIDWATNVLFDEPEYELFNLDKIYFKNMEGRNE